MTRWVSLATDAHPHYAVYAPIVAKLWRRLGFNPIVFLHNEGWDTPFGKHVRESLNAAEPAIVEVPRIEPLSAGNTMRAIRLAACALSAVGEHDTIMLSDIDMAPLSRSFFLRHDQAVVLRADMYGPLIGASSLNASGAFTLIPGLFRFPLCYVNLTAQLWRQILPYSREDADTPVELARAYLVGCRHDSPEWDEAIVSARLLSHPSVFGWPLSPLKAIDEYEQGRLRLVPMTNWPSALPRRMLIGGEAYRINRWVAIDPIDFHMPRPTVRWVGSTDRKSVV